MTRRPERDTAQAMSQQNVEAFKHFVDGFNRRDVEPMLEEVAAGLEWRPAAPLALGRKATVYRGHTGMPDGLRDRPSDRREYERVGWERFFFR